MASHRKYLKLKIALNIYECAHCQKEFEAPPINPPGYGIFFLRSQQRRNLRHLNALENQAYNEVDILLKSIDGKFNDELLRARTLQNMYGEVTCDRDFDGDIFQIGLSPNCPACGSTTIQSWTPTDPVKVVEIGVAGITNFSWDNLSHQEKIEKIRNHLEPPDSRSA